MRVITSVGGSKRFNRAISQAIMARYVGAFTEETGTGPQLGP